MDYNELFDVIKGMSPKQRKTEVCVFEEGTSRYIWPAKLSSDGDPDRPYLEGVASEGDSKARDPIKPNPTGLDAEGNRPHRTKPTGLDASIPPKGGSKST